MRGKSHFINPPFPSYSLGSQSTMWKSNNGDNDKLGSSGSAVPDELCGLVTSALWVSMAAN